MESVPPMTKRTKLLTTCARNDTAGGRFVGFLSTLFLFGNAIDLAKRRLPASSYYKLLMPISLLSALAVAAPIVCIFLWLRPRAPDFARGYRSGSLIVAIFT